LVRKIKRMSQILEKALNKDRVREKVKLVEKVKVLIEDPM